MRLTVAPLRYGAGIKGKVLSSLAAGVPCVMTGCAAEGLALPAALAGLVADAPDELARLIIRLHEDMAWHEELSRAGLDYVAERFAAPVIDAAFAHALATLQPAAAMRLDGAAGN